jgi:hypothetical protein
LLRNKWLFWTNKRLLSFNEKPVSEMLDECFDNHIVVILRFYVTLLTLLPPNTGMPKYPWGAEGSEGSLLSRYPLLSRALKHHPLLEKPDDIVMNIGIINTMAMTYCDHLGCKHLNPYLIKY